MALVKCKECGNIVSDKASNCPRCGYPIRDEATQFQGNDATRLIEKKPQPSKWLYALIAALAIALLGCVAYILFNKENSVGGEPKAEVARAKTDTVAPQKEEVAEEKAGDTPKVETASSKPLEEKAAAQVQPRKGGVNATLTGEISTIQNVKMVLKGTTGSLTYVMDGKRINSNIVFDASASRIDKDGIGHLVLKSFTPQGKLKGRFIGNMDVAECGYLYEGNFVNVNGGSTTFFLTE